MKPSLSERKNLVIRAIRAMEDRLVILQHCEYDGSLSVDARNVQRDQIQALLRSAHSVLADIVELELK